MRIGNNLTKDYPAAGEVVSLIADFIVLWIAVYVLIGQLK
jgi:hypothetical protein